MENQNQIIVVGAGPVGLVAALTLAQSGANVTLLEKRGQLSQASKASTFHPPTLEILDHLGALEAVKPLGYIVDRVQYRTTSDGIIGELPFSKLEGITPFPFRMHLEQSRLTPVLLQSLQNHSNATVHFNADLVNIVDNKDQSTAEVMIDGVTRHLDFSYLMGTDGAHSVVRSLAGISFDGEAYPGKVLRYLTDEDLSTLLPGIGPITYLVNDSHSASFLRMPDCWRIILRVPADVSEETALTDEWALERLRPLIPGLEKLPRQIGKDVYGASKRIASTYRKGNIFLAGDSAHLSNTRGGMNMNCGIHDAFHIARALADATQDQSSELPGQIASERQAIAQNMLIPRSDSMVSAEGKWIDRVRSLLADNDRSLQHLQQTAMLDMTPRLSPSCSNQPI